jgi:hypothetical protein
LDGDADGRAEVDASELGEGEAVPDVSDSLEESGDCWGEPIRCGGSMCCNPESLRAFLATHPLIDEDGYSRFSGSRMFRVDGTNVDLLPSLEGWGWRGDGSEVVLVGRIWSLRCWAQCFNWCFPMDRDLVIVIDAASGELAHLEFLAYRFDWALHFQDAGQPCPPPLESVNPWSCLWVEVPERGIGYNTYGRVIGYWYDEEAFVDDPVLPGVIRVYPLPLVDPVPDPPPQVIDIRVPEVLGWARVCNTADPGDSSY